MNQTPKHLNIEQIELLKTTQPIWIDSRRPQEFLDDARRHLAACEACQRLVSMYEKFDDQFRTLRADGHVAKRHDCPSEVEFWELAMGICPPKRAEEMLEHSTKCEHCAPILRNAVLDFERYTTPEEASLMAGLKSSKPGWQQGFAAQLAQRSAGDAPPIRRAAPRSGRIGWWSFTVPVAACAALVAFIAWFLLSPPERNSERLLAEAYAQRRTMELRIPGASYGPVRIERGERGALPAELHEAMAILLRQLASRPEDVNLLDQKGRAELIQGDFSDAVRTLEHARRIQPESVAVLTDLASAYFQTAENGGPESNYGKSLELLGQVLAKEPNNPVALFNRAIADQKIPSNEQQAIEDWEHYLTVDPKSDWTPEAKRRLEELRRKVSERRSKSAILNTSDFSADSEVEQQLNLAIKQWLPAFYASGTAGNVSRRFAEDSALKSLAHKLDMEHGDRWLTDFLESERSSDLTQGIVALSHAVGADDLGDTWHAQRDGKRAEILFLKAGSIPGVVRARVEEVYALQRSLRVSECLSAAKALERDIKGKAYAWIEIQLLLEESACNNMTAQMDLQEPKLARALQMSQVHSYGILYLRALGFAASLQTSKGNWNQAWRLDVQGLQIYSAGRFPAMRAYQFFSDLALSAEQNHQWHLAAGLWRDALTVLSSSENKALEAQAYYELGSLESLIGSNIQSHQDFERSRELYSILPVTDSTRAYSMNGEISLAALEVRSGNYRSALTRLESVRPDLSLVSDYEIPLHFYQTLGELRLQSGDVEDADRALRTAVTVAESGLQSLKGDSDKLAWEQHMGEAYRSLVELRQVRQGDVIGALKVWEWYRGAALRAHRAEVPALDFGRLNTNPPLPELPDILGSSRSLRHANMLIFARLPHGYAAWFVDDRGIESKWLSGDSGELDNLASTFAEECADPTSNELLIRLHGSQLYNRLIAPLAPRLKAGSVLAIETDGPLSGIPFQALVDETGQYLAERYVIVAFPGVLFQKRLRPDSPFTGLEHVLIIGAPTLRPKLAATFPSLPDAATEGASVASRFRKSLLLSHQEATLRRVRNEMPHAEIFHFAGHSFSTEDQGGLLLAAERNEFESDGARSVLYARDLRPQILRTCKLAVLSSCSTAGTGLGEAMNPDGLVRAFLLAGVPHVVASRWDVDSSSTSVFMDAFYSRLLVGGSVAEAVQYAGMAIQRRHETSHPYFWAAFTPFGLP